jgi:uncharacterized protein Yka (UPF0111/DUF47 family)
MQRTHKQDYFRTLERQSAYGVQAAQLLKTFLSDFDVFRMPETVETMRRIEHEADEVRREMTEALAREFLPPIERGDLLALSMELDDVTDAAEDALRHLYMFNLESATPDAAELADAACGCCSALHRAVCAFRDFKKIDKLRPLLLTVREWESRSDALYTESVRRLYCGINDPRQLLRWTQIYGILENCCDICEHAADMMETVMFKNA